MKILLTGGLGYIGAHMVHALSQSAYQVVVLDKTSNDALKIQSPKINYMSVDLRSISELDDIFKNHIFDAVIHFANYIDTTESCHNPLKYYENNIMSSINILRCMKNYNCNRIIYSSSASVYGNNANSVLDESMSLHPSSPYGRTKCITEQLLQDCFDAHDIRSLSFRYFNAAGAHPSGMLYENHVPETHLIPNLIDAALKAKHMSIFGNNYQTHDGTCIRDYIHVVDICSAHLLGLHYLQDNQVCKRLNLGTGVGNSVLDVVSAVSKEMNRFICLDIKPRRPGDPDKLVASPSEAMRLLNWKCAYSTLENIVKDAYNAYKNNQT